MNRIVNHLRKEKRKILNEGKTFTCFYEYDRNILPNEILIEIFQYLSVTDLRQCLLVSKGWRRVSLYPILWKKVQLNGVTFDASYLERLVNCGVQELDIEYSEICINIQPLATRYFESSTFSTLQYLSMFCVKDQSDLLEIIIFMVPNLKSFSFYSPYHQPFFNSKVFSALLHLKFLENFQLSNIALYFSEIMDIFDKIGSVMNLQSVGLSCVYLEDCDDGTDFVEKYLSLLPNLQCAELELISLFHINDKIFKLFAQLKRLKILKIYNTIVSSEVMKTLNQKKSFVHLKELRIACEEMEEESSILLLRALSNVEILNIHSMFFTVAIFKAILSRKYLQKLGLFDCAMEPPAISPYDDELQKFSNKLSSLYLDPCFFDLVSLSKILSLFKYLDNLTVNGFDYNEAALIEILKMKNLKKLDIKIYCPDGYVEISTLRKITELLRELKELRMKYLTPNFPFEYILSRAPYLKLLEVRRYPINNEFLLGVSSLKKLEELKCELFDEQEDKSGNFFELYVPLQLISLYVCHLVYERTPYQLEMLLSMCRKVKKLYIYGFRATEKLVAIIKTMKELEYLEMKRVAMLRDTCVAEILKCCPKLSEHSIEIEIFEE